MGAGASVQIHVVQLQLPQAVLDRARDIRNVGVYFRCHEKLLTRDAALFDCYAELRLCLVYYKLH